MDEYCFFTCFPTDGIGTTAPTGLLDVGNGSGTSYLVVSATSGPGTVLATSSTINATVPQNGTAKLCKVNVTTRAGQNVMIYGQATWGNNGINAPIGADTAMWLARAGTQLAPLRSVFTTMYYTMHTQTWVEAPGAGTFEYAVYGAETTNRTAPTSQTCFVQVTSLN